MKAISSSEAKLIKKFRFCPANSVSFQMNSGHLSDIVR